MGLMGSNSGQNGSNWVYKGPPVPTATVPQPGRAEERVAMSPTTWWFPARHRPCSRQTKRDNDRLQRSDGQCPRPRTIPSRGPCWCPVVWDFPWPNNFPGAGIASCAGSIRACSCAPFRKPHHSRVCSVRDLPKILG